MVRAKRRPGGEMRSVGKERCGCSPTAVLQEASTPPQNNPAPENALPGINKHSLYTCRMDITMPPLFYCSNSAGILNSKLCVLGVGSSSPFFCFLSAPSALGSVGSFFGRLVLISIVTCRTSKNRSASFRLRRRKSQEGKNIPPRLHCGSRHPPAHRS